jgi:predicted glycosyltransferase
MTATVLFDIGHPAHVHLFKHAIRELKRNGHETRVLSRDKDLTVTLLDRYDIDHTPLSTKGTNALSLYLEWIEREFRTLRAARRCDPDVVVGVPSPPAAHAARLLGVPMVVFDDSERATLQARLTYPFATTICTPEGFERDVGDKQDRYPGYHELAYLHPDRFDPDPDRLEAVGVDPREPYAVCRFVSWGASHDVGNRGLSPDAKRELLSMLADDGEVYVTSEEPLPPAFEPYRLPVPPELIHDLLYYADLYVGDSQTMATESAVLGTPAVRSNSFVGDDDMSNFVELESVHDLLYSRADERETLRLVRDLWSAPDAKSQWRRKRAALLADKIDVTEYMLETILEAAGERAPDAELEAGIER